MSEENVYLLCSHILVRNILLSNVPAQDIVNTFIITSQLAKKMQQTHINTIWREVSLVYTLQILFILLLYFYFIDFIIYY